MKYDSQILHGNIVKNKTIAEFKLTETAYDAGLQIPAHSHDFAYFCFVLRGDFNERCERQTRACSPFSLIFHPPQESHAVDFENDVRILSVQFDFNRYAQIRELSTILDESLSHRSETIAWLGNRIHREFRRMDSFSGLSIEGLVLELLAEASRCKVGTDEKSIPRWLVQAKDFLHDNFAESFVFGDVAKIADVHAVHLSRVFRKTFGCTIGEYVRRLRVEFAARQISLTDEPLGEIAYAAGFADHSHFNRTFKSFYGLTPNQYRQFSRRS